MPRRASASLHPAWIVATVLVIVVAVLGGRYLLIRMNDPFRTIPQMEVDAYLENSDSLRGNVYKLEGTVLNSLAWTPTEGRLFSVEVDASSGAAILPVLIPPEFNAINIQKGQRFVIEIEVGRKGVLVAKEMRKS